MTTGGQQTRLVIVLLMLQDVDREWTAKELQLATGYHVSTIRFHVYALRDDGHAETRHIGLNGAGAPLKLWLKLTPNGVKWARAYLREHATGTFRALVGRLPGVSIERALGQQDGPSPVLLSATTKGTALSRDA